MQVYEFRQLIEDIFLKSFLILSYTYSEQGRHKYFQMLLSKLEQSHDDPLKLEACLFAFSMIEPDLRDNWDHATL
jgi:hypothetical protein